MRNIKLNIANQKGATSIEYALLISLIAVVITASVMILG
jgi:Flp pilus assembly pilin Flp